jgi:hypothetical protein
LFSSVGDNQALVHIFDKTGAEDAIVRRVVQRNAIGVQRPELSQRRD